VFLSTFPLLQFHKGEPRAFFDPAPNAPVLLASDDLAIARGWGTGWIGRPVFSSCFPRLDLGSLGLGLSMSAVRRGSVFLCSFVSGERLHGCGEDGVPSSLFNGGFPVFTADDCTRVGVFYVPGDALRFRSSAVLLTAADSCSSSCLRVTMADGHSAFNKRAGGGSGRRVLQQIHELESCAEEEGGLLLAPVILAGGQFSEAGLDGGGVFDVIFSSSRVYSINLQRCIVLSF